VNLLLSGPAVWPPPWFSERRQKVDCPLTHLGTSRVDIASLAKRTSRRVKNSEKVKIEVDNERRETLRSTMREMCGRSEKIMMMVDEKETVVLLRLEKKLPGYCLDAPNLIAI